MKQQTNDQIAEFINRKASQYPRLDLKQKQTTNHLNRFA